MTHSLQFQ